MKGRLLHRLQGAAAMLLVAAMVMTGMTALAASEQKQITATYNGIRIYVDGAEYVAKDAHGNIVEPFIYNGTTYLPVRGIANAFGKDVLWDGATQSIFLGKKDQNQPDEWLDRIQYSYYGEGNSDNNLWKINGTVTDFLKNDYSNGMLFHVYDNHYSFADDADEAHLQIDYPLNSQYRILSGKVVLPQKIDIAGGKEDTVNYYSQTVDIIFYGDGKKLHEASSVTTTMPFNFEFSTVGVNTLTVKIVAYEDYTYVALTDLALYK